MEYLQCPDCKRIFEDDDDLEYCTFCLDRSQGRYQVPLKQIHKKKCDGCDLVYDENELNPIQKYSE